MNVPVLAIGLAHAVVPAGESVLDIVDSVLCASDWIVSDPEGHFRNCGHLAGRLSLRDSNVRSMSRMWQVYGKKATRVRPCFSLVRA